MKTLQVLSLESFFWQLEKKKINKKCVLTSKRELFPLKCIKDANSQIAGVCTFWSITLMFLKPACVAGFSVASFTFVS